MSVSVHVEFQGLVGLVPLRENGEIHRFLAVLPDLSEGSGELPIPHPDGATEVPPHVSAVLIPSDVTTAPSSKSPALEFRAQNGPVAGTPYKLFTFTGESLQIVGETEEPPLSFSNDVGNETTSPANEADSRDLRWVPQIAKAQRNLGDFNPDLLGEHLTPNSNANSTLVLAATVIIEKGRLFVDDVERDKHGNVRVFDFKDPHRSTEWSQAIYRRIVWETTFVNSPTLVFRAGGDAEPVGVPLGGDDTVRIVVVNREIETLIGVGSAPTRGSGGADVDFAVGYYLCTTVPDPLDGLPVPHLPEGDFGGGDPTCKEGQFNPLNLDIP